MAISREEVLHVARLARLELSEKEVEGYTRQLSRILEYINKLKALPTEGVPATSHVLGLENVVRKDEARQGLSQEDALSNAPDAAGGLFKVPKIKES
ncbi:MAG: Asp-tRNA(Asn)/Glu-tRNA(Gln) amidotransferase subunit GatC [Ignavibacteriales bacterium]